MIDCIGVAGVDASISREVAHTCAAIGAQKSGVPLFLAEGGLELLNNLAKKHVLGGGRVDVPLATALLSALENIGHSISGGTHSMVRRPSNWTPATLPSMTSTGAPPAPGCAVATVCGAWLLGEAAQDSTGWPGFKPAAARSDAASRSA